MYNGVSRNLLSEKSRSYSPSRWREYPSWQGTANQNNRQKMFKEPRYVESNGTAVNK